MKVNVIFDCTPAEARAFFGLPDVQPLQEAMMAELQDKVKGGFKAMEPLEMFNMMLSQYAGGLNHMQNFMNRVGLAASNPKQD